MCYESNSCLCVFNTRLILANQCSFVLQPKCEQRLLERPGHPMLFHMLGCKQISNLSEGGGGGVGVG